jgi:hypothetical protein
MGGRRKRREMEGRRLYMEGQGGSLVVGQNLIVEGRLYKKNMNIYNINKLIICKP